MREAALVGTRKVLDGAGEVSVRGDVLGVEMERADRIEVSTRHTDTSQNEAIEVKELERAMFKDENECVRIAAQTLATPSLS